jgi:hypothetical protein
MRAWVLVVKRWFLLAGSIGSLAALVLGATVFAQNLPSAARLWSVGPLTKSEPVMGIAFGSGGATVTGPYEDSQTSSIYAATRSVVFVGDRLVLASKVGMRQVPEAKIPVQVYQLLSLDTQTGRVKEKREITAFGSLPVFATNDAHVIVAGRNVLRLAPDLKDAGVLDYHGSAENMSPDGSTLGNATNPGYELIDARSLKSTKLSDSPASDTSVSSKGFITDNVHWTGKYPSDLGFITYRDAAGDHLLYHGSCGGRPQFLTDGLILEPGCKSPLIFDTQGNLVRTLSVEGGFSYAGVSQNGKRFALQLTGSGKHERFVIFSVETGEPIAEVKPDKPAEEGQSWTAFSPDGSLFVVGSPLKLTLYRLPATPHTDATTEIVDPKTGNLHLQIPILTARNPKE